MTTFFIGDVALDEYYTADRWPGRADKGMVAELPAETGGSIANAAVVHAALGGRTQFISLLNDSPLSKRLIADLVENGVGVSHMLTDPAIPESRNLIFLVDGEHIVLTVEMGEQPMWLSPDSLTALRQPGLMYTTLYRVRRLHVRTESGILNRPDFWPTCASTGAAPSSISTSAAARLRTCPISKVRRWSSSTRSASVPPSAMKTCRASETGCAIMTSTGWCARWRPRAQRRVTVTRYCALAGFPSMSST